MNDDKNNITRLPFLDGQVTLTSANTNTVHTQLTLLAAAIQEERVTQRGFRTFVLVALVVIICIIWSL